ncbi:unnamed protein product [Schistosoma curassoni]|uniref:Uncharacterized protein n=1 Tax=Schistosoma curassoni TaxID=6186 RepID=A0A183K6G5_9TREM|nr:unnamed protein product [Schistosoma curassoni]
MSFNRSNSPKHKLHRALFTIKQLKESVTEEGTKSVRYASSCYNSNTSNYHNGVAMEPVMELLDIHSDLGALEDYFERFEIWATTKEDAEDVNILSIYDDHLSLSTISKDSVESYGSSELSETQNPCETTVSNQSTYQISHVIVQDMVFPNSSLIFDKIPCKSEGNMLNKPSHDRKPDLFLIDADFSNDLLLCNDILNKFEETILEECAAAFVADI